MIKVQNNIVLGANPVVSSEMMAFLTDVKALIEHGLLHLHGQSRINRRLAIHHAHNAVELTIRKKAEDLGENPYDFPEIIKTLEKHDVKIPHKRELEELNKARILIQHYGTIPDENDIRRLVYVAKDFLIDFWRDIFGINYTEVSLAALISDENTKKA